MSILCVGLILLKRKGLLPFIRQILIVALLFVMNLRIAIPDKDAVIETPSVDAYVMIVIDDTLSMLADDAGRTETRLEAAISDCEYIVMNLEGANIAVMQFNNKAELITPFTNNPSHIRSVLKTIKPIQEIGAHGSSFNLCQDMILNELKSVKEKEDKNVYIFFLSDGESNVDEERKTFAECAEYIDGGAVLGYGTENGGKMKVYGVMGDELGYILDQNFDTAISRIDEENLGDIAKEFGVGYVRMNDEKKLDGIIEEIKENVAITEQELTEMAYKETYYYCLPPLMALLIWDFFHFKRKA